MECAQIISQKLKTVQKRASLAAAEITRDSYYNIATSAKEKSMLLGGKPILLVNDFGNDQNLDLDF